MMGLSAKAKSRPSLHGPFCQKAIVWVSRRCGALAHRADALATGSPELPGTQY